MRFTSTAATLGLTLLLCAGAQAGDELKPEEVMATWVQREVSDRKTDQIEPTCPITIKHLAWKRQDDGTIAVRHADIEHDSLPCQHGTDPDAKALVFYNSSLYSWDLHPKEVAPGEPKPPNIDETLKNMYLKSGPNNRTKRALSQSAETYFFGFERRPRFCNNSANATHSKLQERSTVFVIRPVHHDIDPLFRLNSTLTQGTRWMIVIPRFGHLSCLYSPFEAGRDDDVLDTQQDQRACFPADARVQLRNGGVIAMRELRVSDHVAVGNGQYSPVFGFSHRDPTAIASFVSLQLQSGTRLRVTRTHYVYANGRAVLARDVRVGDWMRLMNATESRVIAVNASCPQRAGLFNPQTLHGDIVVDGVVVSTFTAALLKGAAHPLLTPLRAVYRTCGSDLLGPLLRLWHGRHEWVV